MRMTGTRARRPVSVSLSWPHAARMTQSLESSPLSTNTSRTQTGNSETPQSWLLVLAHTTVINPRRACAARVQYVCLCVSVCLCVCLLPLQQLQRSFQPATNGIYGIILWIEARGFLENPSVQKLWREKANMQISYSSPRAVFAHFLDQRNTAAS